LAATRTGANAAGAGWTTLSRSVIALTPSIIAIWSLIARRLLLSATVPRRTTRPSWTEKVTLLPDR